MPREDKTDAELMLSYQEGSSEAFAALYARHSGKVFGYLKSRVRSEQEAMDLFQEVFIKIHRSRHLYNPSLPALPWIFSVTHSILMDALRKGNQKKEVYGFDFNQLSSPSGHSDDDLASVTPLMKKLTDSQQTALRMRYLDEKTFEDIAISLKTSPTNVRQVISRGLKQLRQLVKKGDPS